MHSLLVEYLRFDNLDTGVLTAGKRYLRLKGSTPVGDAEITIEHEDLLTNLYQLRYTRELTDKAKTIIIRELSGHIERFITNLDQLKYPIQIDLVLNASELGLLPFELFLRKDGKPYFASPDRAVVLTRRIRQSFISQRENWPVIPRVLFVYANPNYGSFREVPYQDHLQKLRWALRHWMTDEMKEQESNKIFTVMPDATFTDFKKQLLQANSGDSQQPYTHVHLLAHGTKIRNEITDDAEYGIALRSELKEPSKVHEFTELFKSIEQKPFVVTYMVCDSGKFTSPIRAEKDIVQQTHKMGVPVVIGSQLPLSFEGSISITRDFYGAILDGRDIREALFETRCNLYSKLRSTHDWFSMIAYVRLPEGYDDYLQESVLQRELSSLITIRENSNKLIDGDAHPSPDDFLELIFDLKQRIEILEGHHQRLSDQKLSFGIFEENAGLIGSGYKRLAELVFRKNLAIGLDTKKSLREQISWLEKAKAWYRVASDNNLSHHWSLVQYLSLNYVLGVSLNEHYWHAAYLAANNAIERNEREVWAYGSLVELSLFTPDLTWKEKLAEVASYLNELVKKVGDSTNRFPITSTRQQLNRYVNWWTEENGFNVKTIKGSELKKVMEILP